MLLKTKETYGNNVIVNKRCAVFDDYIIHARGANIHY